MTAPSPTPVSPAEQEHDALLTVSGLRVSAGGRELLHGLDLRMGRGERVGLIGESGSGKSLTCFSVMGLLPETLTATGSVQLAGAGELLGRDERSMSALRGDRLSMVFQEPMTALNPLARVGDQVAEVIRLHRSARGGRRGGDPAALAVEALAGVRLPDPARAARAYPHELSGGQRQRVVLAMAMANTPDLLLADEPTTALDVTVQAQVLDLMRAQVRDAGSSLLFITHDLGIVASVCERVVIMRHGEVVEAGELDRVFSDPQHPYTRGLLAASSLQTHPRTGRLLTASDVVRATQTPAAPAAPDTAGPEEPSEPSEPSAAVAPPARRRSPLEDAPHDVLDEAAPEQEVVFNRARPGTEVALGVTSLVRSYRRAGGLLRRSEPVHALRGVSFDVRAGERFGVVGESGCGKSTLLRLVTGLDQPTGGRVELAGRAVSGQRESQLRWLRSQVQVVFQDPMGSLDPRMRIGDVVAEPLRGAGREERRERVAQVLEQVGLPRASAERFPHQFSGGQRQRIAIARALITRPRVLVADEAVSALDVSVRAQVLNLLDDLVDEHELTLVFVSHDLHVVRHTCDTVAVMQAGRVVECGPADAVLGDPRHPYTRQLVAALPRVGALA